MPKKLPYRVFQVLSQRWLTTFGLKRRNLYSLFIITGLLCFIIFFLLFFDFVICRIFCWISRMDLLTSFSSNVYINRKFQFGKKKKKQDHHFQKKRESFLKDNI